VTVLLDRLRRVATAPDEYAWAAVALGVSEARSLLELVERLTRRVAELEAAAVALRRCADCGRAARELTAVQDGDGHVVHLGPGCYRKRAAALGQREQLPIGGVR
jgi:hypothetical protein